MLDRVHWALLNIPSNVNMLYAVRADQNFRLVMWASGSPADSHLYLTLLVPITVMDRV